MSGSENGGTVFGTTSKFHVDHDINAKLYLWRGTPWALEVDAVVNSSNEVSLSCFAYSWKGSVKLEFEPEVASISLTYSVQLCEQNLDEAHSSPGLHPAAGPGLAEECATLVSDCSSLLFELGFLKSEGHLACCKQYVNIVILMLAMLMVLFNT